MTFFCWFISPHLQTGKALNPSQESFPDYDTYTLHCSFWATDESCFLFLKVPWKGRWDPICLLALTWREAEVNGSSTTPRGPENRPASPQIRWCFLRSSASLTFVTRHTLSRAELLPLVYVIIHSLGLPASNAIPAASCPSRTCMLAQLHTPSKCHHPSATPLSSSKKFHPWFSLLPPLCIWKSNLSWQLILHPVLGLYLYHSIP